MAVQAIVEARLDCEGDEQATMYRLRMGIEAAAALADLVAGAGANKALTLDLGGVHALLGCIEQHVANSGLAGTEHDTEGSVHRLLGELCLQACRALGNLCYGWDVDAIKAAVGARGASVVVGALHQQLVDGVPGAAHFRWKAHVLRNLAVRSKMMQDAIGVAGGPAELARGLAAFAVQGRAQEAGCKALAVRAATASNLRAANPVGHPRRFRSSHELLMPLTRSVAARP